MIGNKGREFTNSYHGAGEVEVTEALRVLKQERGRYLHIQPRNLDIQWGDTRALEEHIKVCNLLGR
jgi:hypothetical protein